MTLAVARLTEERKQWRKDHPFGFVAKPQTNADGSLNLLHWDCAIPGKAGTLWEGGLYSIKLTFSDSYPMNPPKCAFSPALFHPNIFPSGSVCLSILSSGWKPSITLKELYFPARFIHLTSFVKILLGIQELLDDPNPKSPAHEEAYKLFRADRTKYDAKIREQAAKFKPKD